MDFSYFQSYQQFNEMSIHNDDFDSKSSFISDVSKLKQNLRQLDKKIFELINIMSNEDSIELTPHVIENIRIIFHVEIIGEASKVLDDIKKYTRVSDDRLRKKYCSVIYPDGEERSFSTEIQLEPNNFNRIHLRIGIPTIFRGIGLGKKIYRAVIKKYGYISTNKFDRTLDAINVWDSIRKDVDVYSFISMKDRMLCVNIDKRKDTIIKLLLKFFEPDIKERMSGKIMNTYVLDTDFRMKFYDDIEKTDLKYILEKPYNV